MRGARLLVLVLLIEGCHRTVAIEPPTFEDARSIFVALRIPDQAPTVFAFTIDESKAFELPPLSSSGSVELYALGVPCTLNSLGLPAGRLELEAEPADQILLPTPSLMRSTVSPDGQTPWTREDTLDDFSDELVRRFPVDQNLRCKLFAPTFERIWSRDIETSSTVRVVLPATGGRALIGTHEGEFFEVEIGEELIPRADLEGDFSPEAGAVDGDGTMWMVTRNGQIRTGDLDGLETIDVRTSTFAEDSNITIALSDRGPAEEIFLVSGHGNFERFDGQAWEQLFLDDEGGHERSDVVWIRPGEALAIGAARDVHRMLRYKDGEIIEERLPPNSGEPNGVDMLEGFGLVVGTQDSRFFSFSDGEWVEFRTRPEPVPDDIRTPTWGVKNWIPYDGGFVVGRTGSFGSWFLQFPEEVDGYCTIDLMTTRAVEHLLNLDGRLLMISRPFLRAPEVSIQALVQNPPEVECATR